MTSAVVKMKYVFHVRPASRSSTDLYLVWPFLFLLYRVSTKVILDRRGHLYKWHLFKTCGAVMLYMT